MASPFLARVSPAPDVMLRVIGDEAVILNLKSERYLGLNQVGTRMLTFLQSAPSVEAVYETLLAEFDVEPQRLRQDLNQLLDQMLQQGLIELGPGKLRTR